MGKMNIPMARSVSTSEYGDVSVEYSIALEYTGPSPPPEHHHNIPRAVPLDFDQIPVAKEATSTAVVGNLAALPVVQPIAARTKRGGGGATTTTTTTTSSNLGRYAVDTDSGNCNSTGSDIGISQLGINQIGGKDRDVVSRRNSDGSPVNGTESSGTLGFSDSRDHSHELSGSSDMLETPLDCQEIRGLRRYMDSGNWNSNPQVFSVEVSSSDEEGSDDGGLKHRNRRSTVTFVEPESGELVEDEYQDSGIGDEDSSMMSVEDGLIPERRPVPQRVSVKKGLCCRCLKGNRFTDKVACFVCDSKYCISCVLRAMGSMPEGRKCLTCIGYPILESKRRLLGRSSKLLKRLLSEDEVKQILRTEVSCEANQIPSDLIVVNQTPLCQEELVLLQSCPIPPRNLNPGNYWYDKVSGLWGKEGHKPCQIISHNLDVGGHLSRDASNGDTNVQINGRVITKAELWMLQSSGVQCDGVSSLWLNPDGSFSEEGMNVVKGKIWGKKRTKVLCSLLSLPTPESPQSIQQRFDSDAHSKFMDQHALNKLLLVGNDQSGTCTIYKQARVLYNRPFSEEEHENIKWMIQSKLYGYLAILLEAREVFEEESVQEIRRRATEEPGPSDRSNMDEHTIYSINKKLKGFSDWLIGIMVAGNLDIVFPAATREYAPCVEELWRSAAFQATYSRKDELGLPRSANYFLDKAVEIAKVDYEPSDIDILYAEGITSCSGVSHVDFSFPNTPEDGLMDSVDQYNHLARYQLIRVHAKSLGENCKWVEMFEDINLVIFCVALCDYDEYEVDHTTCSGEEALINKMLLSKRLFENLVTHPAFKDMNFLLILNKFDLLEEKIERSPITQCEWFQDFNPVLSRHQNNPNYAPPLAQRAFHYIAVKFKRLFKELTCGRKLYVSPVTALEQDTVDGALRYAREILRWEEEKYSHHFSSINEISSESIEASSS